MVLCKNKSKTFENRSVLENIAEALAMFFTNTSIVICYK
jgi:K+-transporting ATPase A subunit